MWGNEKGAWRLPLQVLEHRGQCVAGTTALGWLNEVFAGCGRRSEILRRRRRVGLAARVLVQACIEPAVEDVWVPIHTSAPRRMWRRHATISHPILDGTLGYPENLGGFLFGEGLVLVGAVSHGGRTPQVD